MFKSRSSQRFKALNAMRHFISRIIIMTGTPSPNGYLDLWSQAFLLDKGERLFSSITRYRDTYFNANPYIPYATPTLKPQAAPLINRKLSDIAISMEQKDYLDLEPIQYRPTTFTPSPTLLKHYDDMRKNMVLNLQGGSSTDWLSTTVHSISAATVAAASNKLLQLTSGVVYDDDKQPRTLCTSKQEAFDDIAQTAFGNHRNMLVFYSFIHERDHILRTYPNEAHLIDEPTEPGQPSIIERWNAGQIPMLVMHPASGGHGLNLQDGGNTVVWYSMTYNLEHWLQGNKRVHRMGQTKPVVVYVLLTQDLIDNHVYNNALTAKRDNQQALIDALKAPMHGQA
jgi:hypothetical protein